MALSLQAAVLAKRRAMNYDFKKPHTRRLIRTLFEILSQQKGNPDLQIAEFDNLTGDKVLADAGCRLYGIVLTKETATVAFFKGDDSATAVSATASMIVLELNETDKEIALIWPDGYTQANGFTVTSHTTADGAVASSAGDGPRGFAIIGG